MLNIFFSIDEIFICRCITVQFLDRFVSQREYFSSWKRRVYRLILFYTVLDSSERNFRDRNCFHIRENYVDEAGRSEQKVRYAGIHFLTISQ